MRLRVISDSQATNRRQGGPCVRTLRPPAHSYWSSGSHVLHFLPTVSLIAVQYVLYLPAVSLAACSPFPPDCLCLSCCRTAVGVGQRALSLSAHTAGGPPPLAPGRMTSPRHILGVWRVLLWRRCYGERVVFNHLRESLNPFLHTGGPRCGRSFRCRLRRWRRWHGSRSVETTSYVNVRRRL